MGLQRRSSSNVELPWRMYESYIVHQCYLRKRERAILDVKTYHFGTKSSRLRVHSSHS